MNLYINVKKSIIYINVWSLSYTVLAMGFLFVSSGRQVIERKLAERGDPVSEKKQSETWKFGVILYSMALPWIFTANLLYFVFYKDDMVAQVTIEYGGDWRIPIIWLSHLLPLSVLVIDFFLNKLIMAYKHVWINVLLMALYFFCTYVGQIA
jgi:hypothetical protein